MDEKKLKPLEDEFQAHALDLGHMMKYNMYLLSKAIIFSSLMQHTESVPDAVEATEYVMSELDLTRKKSTDGNKV